MNLTLDFNNVMSDVIGHEHGLRPEDIDVVKGRGAEIHKNLQERRKADIGFYSLPYDNKLLREVLSLSKELAGSFDNLIVLGIGGSSLGGRAIFNALCHPYHNLLSRTGSVGVYPRLKRNASSIFFCDNIDPDSFEPLLKMLDLRKTLFNVITKSGETAETVAQFLAVKKLLEKEVGKKYKNHIVITTDPIKGPLRKLAGEEGFKTLSIPPNVGGRYSVFSAVGLFPSTMAGVDIKKLLAGARDMDKVCSIDNIWKNPAYMSAIIQYLAYQRGKNISVIMPYSNALRDFSEWYIQLWAESLGKSVNLKGKAVNIGPTPVKAIGTTDQHSQLQLYMEGPYDKIITFIEVKKFKNEVSIPKMFEDFKEIGYLGGRSMEELFRAELVATRIALTKNKRMNYTITIPDINPFTIGQLLFFFEVQTAFAGGLFNVNPFNQPGVEEGKKLTYGMMGKKGYEKKGAEVKEGLRRNKRYVIQG
ncbi:MAG: glucose-6-phosphate isomerase [Deltaproteobacteria bacterium RIFCSPLOWO2_12_FULL_43_16]|nr:MAG: glucose-6-phosphate isomerase [Deltaproteobacteria bacterium GWA2_43_19]OGQ09650.1 MAG: glucose-6-phosphate isomerase [Deltaproteobacteria bacterium RIFCSPHIGHO2_02_FULL_43_33]OGQ41253.1 MAG: glucose-6-phosphate isomerase [Deltaproteobacteria bacterium RIFCSPLOWO2_01_FULL_42_9]OGQ57476.1 MAG: glucose-6-phosphate isomerase [Deltaproteobacteria bacterium RIFCSPLOWO2_12_FULL_43_16]HBR17501.1 glucose-6-phosphate isomerase [Deltaproteobacteria bacterium]